MTRTLAFLLALAASPLSAEEIPADIEPGLSAAVEAFSEVIASGNLAGTFDYMPPEVLNMIASQAGVSVEEVLAATKAQIETALQTVTIDSYAMDLDTATWETTPDGSTQYAMIPTETVMTIEGNGQMKAQSQTLALQGKADVWYLVRIDDAAQADLFRAAYPAFAGVDFPAGTIAALE